MSGELDAPPDGFVRHTRRSPLTDPWEPIYSRKTEAALRLGLRLREAHCNSRGFVHGGLISALADNSMGLSCALALGGARLVTVSLTVDFLDSAQIGAWLEVDPGVVRTGKTLCFAHAFVTADGAPHRAMMRTTPTQLPSETLLNDALAEMGTRPSAGGGTTQPPCFGSPSRPPMPAAAAWLHNSSPDEDRAPGRGVGDGG